jgi:hypothetical protein
LNVLDTEPGLGSEFAVFTSGWVSLVLAAFTESLSLHLIGHNGALREREIQEIKINLN